MALSFDQSPEPVSQEPLSYDTSVASDNSTDVGVNSDIATERAMKFQYAGVKAPSHVISDAIQNGDEASVRQKMSDDDRWQKAAERQQKIKDLVTSRPGVAITNADLANIDVPPAINPNWVMEEKYSGAITKYLDINYHNQFEDKNVNWDWRDTLVGKASPDMQYIVKNEANKASSAIFYREYSNTKLENAQNKLGAQGWLSWGVDMAKGFVPGFSDYELRGNVPDVGVLSGGIGLGTNLQEQADALLRMPKEEFTKNMDRIMTYLEDKNPSAAVRFAQYVTGRTTSERHLDNLFTVIDATSVAGALPLTAKLAKSLNEANQIRQAYKQLTKAVEGPLDKARILESTGDVGEAVVEKVVQQVGAEFKGTANPTLKALDALPKMLRADREAFLKNTGDLSREGVNRIVEQYNTVETNLVNIMKNLSRVERIPDSLATEKAVRAIREDIKGLYKGINNNVLDLSNPYKEVVANVWKYDMKLGQTGSDLFVSEQQAKSWANLNGIIDPTIEQQGAGFYIRLTKNLNETSMAVRDGMLTTKFSEPPMSWANSFFGKLRSPEETLSVDQRMARKVATYAPSVLVRLARENIKEIEKLSRGSILRQDVQLFSKDIKGFKTAKGSEYTIQPDETTIRNKALRNEPGHEGDQGLKPKSEKTVYVDEQSAAALAPTKNNWRMIDHGDGTLSLSTPSPGKGWGISPSARNIPYGTKPEVGMIPIELFSPGQVQGAASFKNVHFGNKITEITREQLGTTRMSRGERFEEWKRIVEQGRDEIDPATGLKGRFYDHAGELSEKYLQNWGRTPETDEVAAYFAWKRQVELDRTFRNLAMYRNKARVGAESYSVSSALEDGSRSHSVRFDGVRRKVFPGGDDNILIMGPKYGDEQVKSLGHIGGDIDKLRENVNTGKGTIIELFDPENRPLAGYSDKVGQNRVRYVYTEAHDSKELSWDQVPRRGGGHFEYDYEHYIKQASIKTEGKGTGAQQLRNWYEGDITVMPIKIRAMGHEVSGKMNDVRALLNEGKTDEAKAMFNNHDLPMTWKEFKSWFDPQMVNGELQPPRLSKSEPFQVVPAGKTINEMDNTISKRYEGFKDGTREGSIARQSQIEFTGQRDAWDVMTVKNTGTHQNPLYSYEPAEKIDPITSMNRGLQSIINSTFMDDYKTSAVEHWLRSAEKYLKEDQDARYAPFKVFHTPDNYRRGVPEEVKRQLETQRFQINQLLGIPSSVQANLHSMAQTLTDSIYTKYGAAAAERLPLDSAMAWIQDPVAFMRKATFHAKLGLFNIPQLFVQANTFINILGVAGMSKAAPGTMGAVLHGLSGLTSNPNIFAHMDNLATKLRMPGMSAWKPGEWTEAKQALDSTGFGNVGREYAILDDLSAPLVKSGVDDFLDAGSVFFRNGEKSVRHGAWYTAYRELRDANPLRVMDDKFKQEILNRADLLNVNMSRASNSLLHTGWASLPTQFLAYQIRSAELFWGGRLTPLEKTRLFGTYAAVYGFPTSIGLTGAPAYDIIRNYAIDNGYTVDPANLKSWVMEGAPAMASALISGDAYNFGQRYGTGGFSFLNSDKTFLEIAGGAAFSTFKGAFEATDGFRKATMSMIKGDGAIFPYKSDDFFDPFKEISGVNRTWGLWFALHTGELISKKDMFVGPTSKANAIFSYITGLSPQENADIHNITMTSEDQKEYFKEVEKRFVQEFQRGLRSQEKGDSTQAADYFKRAMVWLDGSGYPQEDRAKAFSKAASGNESLIERIQKSFYTDHVPEDKREERLDAYRKILTKQQGK